MTKDIIKQILTIIIQFSITGALGYCVSTIKNLKKKRQEKEDRILQEIENLKKQQQIVLEDQLDEMRTDLSNKFYVYDAMEEVEDYLVTSFREKCEKYFDKGGDRWVHPMFDKSFKWKVKVTGYLK